MACRSGSCRSCFLLLEPFLGFAFGGEGRGFGGRFRRRGKFLVERSDLFVGFGFGGGFLLAGFGELFGERGGFVLGKVGNPAGAEDFGVMGMLSVFFGVFVVFVGMFFGGFGFARQGHFRFSGGFDGKLGERLSRSSGFDRLGVSFRQVRVVRARASWDVA